MLYSQRQPDGYRGGALSGRTRGDQALAKKRKDGDYYETLRARFSGKPEPRVSADFKPPADPTDRFFGAEPVMDEPKAARLFDPAGVRPLADDLAKSIDARGRGRTALMAQTLRLVIGLGWLALAFWYLRGANADAAALGSLFATIGAAGVGAGILGLFFAWIFVRPGAKKIRADAGALGERIALESQSLSESVGKRADLVSADAFLSRVDFADGGGAEKFHAYLGRTEEKKAPKPGAVLFIAGLAIAVAAAIAAALGANSIALPLAGFPLALTAIALGAGLYAAAGLIARIAGKDQRRASEAHAETLAFDAATAAYAEAGGPALAPLRTRLFGNAGARPDMNHSSLDDSREYESANAQKPDWRTRDSGPAFVETGFQAAPRTFRTDAFEKKFRR